MTVLLLLRQLMEETDELKQLTEGKDSCYFSHACISLYSFHSLLG